MTNIIIEPNSVSQQFVVYGVETMEDYLDDELEWDDLGEDTKGVVFTLDFTNLHEPQCKNLESAGDGASDYELWSPFDGRHGKDKCFMGSKTTYVRRKREAQCYNGEEIEKEIRRAICSCTEMDYECDAGYMRSEDSGTCIKIEGKDGYNHLTFQQDV